MPLITSETIKDLIERAEEEKTAATTLTGIISEPSGYGRIIRQNNKIVEIVEAKERRRRGRYKKI